jgi:predicted PurR-regulated permease PerM
VLDLIPLMGATIGAVLFGGTLFGVIGALIADPSAACAQIVVREILGQRRALHINTNRWGLDRMETAQRR